MTVNLFAGVLAHGLDVIENLTDDQLDENLTDDQLDEFALEQDEADYAKIFGGDGVCGSHDRPLPCLECA